MESPVKLPNKIIILTAILLFIWCKNLFYSYSLRNKTLDEIFKVLLQASIKLRCSHLNQYT